MDNGTDEVARPTAQPLRAPVGLVSQLLRRFQDAFRRVRTDAYAVLTGTKQNMARCYAGHAGFAGYIDQPDPIRHDQLSYRMITRVIYSDEKGVSREIGVQPFPLWTF
jgi:hypothetical protein